MIHTVIMPSDLFCHRLSRRHFLQATPGGIVASALSGARERHAADWGDRHLSCHS